MKNLHTPSADRAASKLLTVDEVADLLALPRSWVYEAARTGTLPHVRLGRYVRFRPSDVVNLTGVALTFATPAPTAETAAAESGPVAHCDTGHSPAGAPPRSDVASSKSNEELQVDCPTRTSEALDQRAETVEGTTAPRNTRRQPAPGSRQAVATRVSPGEVALIDSLAFGDNRGDRVRALLQFGLAHRDSVEAWAARGGAAANA